MPVQADLLDEADRQLTVCNACRYCEGYCAVFPAMERRGVFSPQDLVYMANLCFECRACYYACPYTPPHDYAINIPAVFAALRSETYREMTPPSLLARLLQGRLGVAAGVALALVALVFGAVVVRNGGAVFESNTEPGAFYGVVPYLAMLLPALALALTGAGALALGGIRFWRSTRAAPGELIDLRAFLRATKDALGLEYLKGGGEGCSYPDSRFSHARRWFHHVLVWGILLDLASTTLAAVYHNLLGRDAPYAYLSPPVLLGTAGGVLILVGVVGLVWLKARSDKEPASPRMLVLDQAFLYLLAATSLSGLLLLALRETAAMGTLLAVHLGIVAALFLLLPYGKFAHVVYRYAALVRYRLEEGRDELTRA